MKMPTWAKLDIPSINYQDIVYYAAPKKEEKKSWDDVDPELKATFDKLGIPLDEQKTSFGSSGGCRYGQCFRQNDV